jgi:hypothetical protein
VRTGFTFFVRIKQDFLTNFYTLHFWPKPTLYSAVSASMFRYTLLLLFFYCFDPAKAQVIYTAQGDATGTNLSFGTLDLETCTYTEINPGPIIEFQDFCLGPNGEIYVAMIGLGLGIYDPISNISTLIVPIPDFLANSVEILPNGLIYAAGSTLWEIDPVAGTFLVLGNLNFPGEGDLAYINGQLYLTGNTGSGSCLVLVNIADPGNSTCVLPLPYTNNTGLVNVPSSICGDQLYGTGIIIDPNTSTFVSYVYKIDLNNNTVTEVCAFTGITGYSDFAIPFDYDFPGPCCDTDAGSIDPDTIQACINQPIILPHNNNQVLDGNDALQFAISSDPNNIKGSILVRQNTPVFTYSAGTMVPNVVYYGNNLGGGVVDLNDPCYDPSNVIAVIWRALPSIQFAAPSDVCADTGCFEIQAQLSGEPPFILDYAVKSGNNTLLSESVTLLSTNSSINICPPNGFSGPLNIVATKLTDARCVCTQ